MIENDGTDRIETEQQDRTITFDGARQSARFDARSLDARLEAGSPLGRYRLMRKLGAGGSAQVWEAERVDDQRRVALKILGAMDRAPREAIARFEQEGRLAASLSHPHCVYVFGAEEIEGLPTIAMELMTGGSLRQLLEREGPLEPRRAVAMTLEVLRGLDAAAAQGIVHRDVKPANCFLDGEGTVRLGDFGISKSLELDSEMTATGAFLGTPVYAAPEQIRGERVDFRSDMYSLGATLYELLSGKPPFEGSGGRLLSAILNEPPIPLQRQRPELPRGLCRVVHRLLRKEPDRRFKSYARLRAALVPYGRQALRPTDLGRRFLAYIVDSLLVIPVIFAFAFAIGSKYVGVGEVLRVLTPAITVLYFGALEGLTGASLGKRALNLCVRTAEGERIRPARAFARALVYAAFGVGTSFFPNVGTASFWVASGVGFLMLATMRVSNGFAMIHDLLTGTRVMEGERESERPALDIRAEREPAPVAGGIARLGPYEIIRTLDQASDLLLGWDPVLYRHVWVYTNPRVARSESAERLRATRTARLRWLQSGGEEGVRWSAFEAPAGRPYREIVGSGRCLEWSEMRHLVLDLAVEIRASLDAGELPEPLSLAHLWVDGFGRLRLLDRPFGPGEDASGVGWLRQLRDMIALGLTGRTADGAVSAGPPDLPLPGTARSTLIRLWSEDFAEKDLVALVVDLRASLRRPAAVDRKQRVLAMTVAAIPPALVAAFFGVVFGALFWFQADEWRVVLTDLPKKLEQIAQWREEGNLARAAAAEQFLTVAVGRVGGSDSWIAQRFDEQSKTVIARLAATYPDVKEDEIAAARVTLKGTIFVRSEKTLERGRSVRRSLPMIVGGAFLFTFGFVGVAAVLWSAGFRRPLLFRISGIDVCDLMGRPASRLRCFVRALLVWSPALAAATLFALPFARSHSAMTIHSIDGAFGFGYFAGFAANLFAHSGWPLALLLAAGVASILWRPNAGLADWIARTRLVPE